MLCAAVNPVLSAPAVFWATQRVRFDVNLVQTLLKPTTYNRAPDSCIARFDVRVSLHFRPKQAHAIEAQYSFCSACGQQVPQPITSDWNSNRWCRPHCHDPPPSNSRRNVARET